MWCGGVYFAVMMELGRTIQRAWRTGQQQQQQQQSRASRVMAVMEVIPVILAIGHPPLDMIWFGKGPSDPAVTISVASLRRRGNIRLAVASGVHQASLQQMTLKRSRPDAVCSMLQTRGQNRSMPMQFTRRPVEAHPCGLAFPVIVAAHHVDDNSFFGHWANRRSNIPSLPAATADVCAGCTGRSGPLPQIVTKEMYVPL